MAALWTVALELSTRAPCFHEVLGVRATANATVISRAYRSAAKTTHPDKGGSANAFLALSAAEQAMQRIQQSSSLQAAYLAEIGSPSGVLACAATRWKRSAKQRKRRLHDLAQATLAGAGVGGALAAAVLKSAAARGARAWWWWCVQWSS